MEAARLGSADIVDLLLAAGADPKRVLDDGTSAATIARRFENESLSRKLRRRGAPMQQAIAASERLEVLENRAARSKSARPSLPPVVEAARRGDVELLREMVRRKIDLNVVDAEGGNALTRAAGDGHADALEILLSAGVDPNLPGREGATALMRAMASQSEGADLAVEVLLRFGADPHARDRSGRAMIEYAAWGASRRKLELIRAAGGSWTPISVRTSLSEAAAADRVPVVEALLTLLTEPKQGADAVCRAIEQKHVEILDLLAAAKMSLEGECGRGLTPLAVAAHLGEADLVRRLIEAGAELDGSGAERDTALIAAAGRGHGKILDLLIQNGASVNHRGARRMTALMAAASNGRVTIVQALLAAGADRHMRSDTKQTALDLAQQSENLEVVAAIESFRPGWAGWFSSAKN
jgi:ankyrin repeat protein